MAVIFWTIQHSLCISVFCFLMWVFDFWKWLDGLPGAFFDPAVLLFGKPIRSMPIFWPALIPYVIWIFFDQAPEKGGRKIESVRQWKVWKLLASYFPVSLIKVSEVFGRMKAFYCNPIGTYIGYEILGDWYRLQIFLVIGNMCSVSLRIKTIYWVKSRLIEINGTPGYHPHGIIGVLVDRTFPSNHRFFRRLGLFDSSIWYHLSDCLGNMDEGVPLQTLRPMVSCFSVPFLSQFFLFNMCLFITYEITLVFSTLGIDLEQVPASPNCFLISTLTYLRSRQISKSHFIESFYSVLVSVASQWNHVFLPSNQKIVWQ